jgi:hypothetical protein
MNPTEAVRAFQEAAGPPAITDFVGYAPLPMKRLPHDVPGEKLYGATATVLFKLARLVVLPMTTAPWVGPTWWGRRKPSPRRLSDAWVGWMHGAQRRAVAGCGIDRFATSPTVDGDDWESLLAIETGSPIDVIAFLADSFVGRISSPPARRVRVVVVGEKSPLSMLALVHVQPPALSKAHHGSKKEQASDSA